ncbi:MAG TPA: crossover junction endodeoxyribonuclease RuvC [Planctomycetota bacterium]|nr:crossover junction endodeoxyribonuclease RuvC [Planctomycetota bacterium]
METFTAANLTLAVVAVLRILGIDPGTVVVGFGCLELTTGGVAMPRLPPLALRASNAVQVAGGGELRFVTAGTIRLGRRGDTVAERLHVLAQRLGELLDRLAPYEVALEEAFCGKSVQSALRIGEARGVVMAESGRRRLVVHEYSPARIKRCVAGSGVAAKATVAVMLAHLLPGAAQCTESLPADASDALAVALTRAEERRSPLLSPLLTRADGCSARGPH